MLQKEGKPTTGNRLKHVSLKLISKPDEGCSSTSNVY